MSKNKKSVYLCLSIFLVLGIFSIVMGVKNWIESKNSISDLIETQAVISDIETYKDKHNERHFRVLVDYSVGSFEYKDVELGVYMSNMDIGKKIDILVNPQDPMNIKMTSQDSINTVAGIIMGIIFILFSGIPLILIRKGIISL